MMSPLFEANAGPNSEVDTQGIPNTTKAVTPKAIVSVVLAASAVPSSATSKSSRATMKPTSRVPPEIVRAWSDWLTKVVQIVSCEWEEWLLSHIDLVLKLNEYLLKAAELMAKSGFIDAADSCSTIGRKESRTTNGSEYSNRAGYDMAPKESNLCLPACHCTKDEEEEGNKQSRPIDLPTNVCEMNQVIEDFKRNARKYRILYRNWSKMTQKVRDEIAKPPYVSPELDFLTKIENICAEDDCDSDDEEVLRTDDGFEFITFGNQNLMFNLNGGCDMDYPSQQVSQILSIKECPSIQLGSVKSGKTISAR
ncbi:hypothetical protein QAD02_011715 [Eretmocerus hayati]|uniref:Uncharacterized protein n=1 Tax=Eretmocerus hayati TaxID=131215 RepID=A0ACC2NXX9_9HYME|nr:hypothetical protein QAD02_011715 [Eretmocerus hayati]